jgi:CRP-like cAMP-binding protein
MRPAMHSNQETVMRKVLFILSELLDEDVEWLAENGERLVFPSGEMLIGHGSQVDSVYFVLDGLFGVLAKGGDVIVELGTGEIIGEMSLVDPAPTTAAVHARPGGVALRLPHAVLRARLDSDNAFAARFYRALSVFMSDRIRQTTRRFGYGGGLPDPSMPQLEPLNDELASKVYLAGARFDRLLRRLAA